MGHKKFDSRVMADIINALLRSCGRPPLGRGALAFFENHDLVDLLFFDKVNSTTPLKCLQTALRNGERIIRLGGSRSCQVENDQLQDAGAIRIGHWIISFAGSGLTDEQDEAIAALLALSLDLASKHAILLVISPQNQVFYRAVMTVDTELAKLLDPSAEK